ncbi:MAG TPA: hypothetical protein PKE06_07940 [Flavilitoribacter sp.]|nr:hypothetical protein [Flavilitoribacter sp.]
MRTDRPAITSPPDLTAPPPPAGPLVYSASTSSATFWAIDRSAVRTATLALTSAGAPAGRADL